MLVPTFLLIILTTVIADNLIHIQYFRRPEEYGIFRLDLENGSKVWESFIYMNKSANIREEDIYKLIKPFFEEDPSTRRYESSSITRHLGKQFEYILNKYPVNEIIFENLCSQMKPKFSSLLTSSSQLPRKIKWVIEHPSAFFLIPYGFTKGVGRDEYYIEIKGRASFDQGNFNHEALQNTRKLVIKNESEMKNVISGDQLMKVKAPEVLIQGWNDVKTENWMQLIKEWVVESRSIHEWEVHLSDQKQFEQSYFERNGTTLELSVKNGRLLMRTYKTPENRSYKFTAL